MSKIKKRVDYIPAVGKRKSAIARIRLSKKEGEKAEFTINGKTVAEYLPYFEWQDIIMAPLKLANRLQSKITVQVLGGGPRGQAEAIRLGLSRALLKSDQALKKPLRAAGFLTRDSRKKERKKPGLKRARRAPQWSKR